MTDDFEATALRPEAGQGPERTPLDRITTWLRIAEGHAEDINGYRLYPSDWRSLASAIREIVAAWGAEPSDEDVERVVEALKPFDNRYRVDGRVRSDGEVEWFISDRDLPAGVFVFGPILDQDACRTEFKQRRARAAIDALRAKP